MAILKLAEQGKIKLDQKVFSEGGLLGNDYGSKPADLRVKDITVKELLDHSAGFENDNNNNTSFISSMSASKLIRLILDSAPGRNLNFSFLGYMILGKIIEKVTAKTYEEYVQLEILHLQELRG